MTARQVLSRLRKLANPENVEGMARYGISTAGTLGVSIPELRRLAREIGRDHSLALELWDSGVHEARILAPLIDVPSVVTEEQLDRWMPGIVSGEVLTAVAVTEPDAGSDVAGIKTRAVRDGDDWVINGSKIYITNAAIADWMCVLVVSDPEAGYGGYSQIVVPTDAPGFSYELLDKIGNWGSDTGLLHFDDVRVPATDRIGADGTGWATWHEIMHDGIIMLAAQAIQAAGTAAGFTGGRAPVS